MDIGTQHARTTPDDLSDEMVSAYRREGFIHLPGVISAQEAKRFADAAMTARRALTDHHSGSIFTQLLQLWQHDQTLRELTLNPDLADLATRLAGVPLRLWHDQLLIKEPRNGAATEFHQDQPYWPHAGARHALSAWIALVDVPVERGCMTFIPGSQHLDGLRPQDLADSADLLGLAPELVWERRVTVPLRAGDCTFHNARLAHTATPNFTDDPRVAHVVIYVDADVTFAAEPSHPVTDPLGLTVGGPLPDEHFPRFGAIGSRGAPGGTSRRPGSASAGSAGR
ncbi:phytanoyl-CoA dioxygenase family protein [Actinoallomurus purpureus]|uniref:phytanoyl-CoA dioxygenase family protein n=1 Tax=Actinoallomurus purpureus TaxID=478114 RepID=UPI002093DB2E|nr:phytanoyl-CoA dioxygenase family protein [Actinoallomurus purpureus]MCO6007096.1 phytanoyl-CoA dioxygenase family protein [Actinoallomurus purpureus]